MSQQLWAVDSLGGYLSNDTLSKQIRHASQTLQKFRQFVDVEPAAGKGKGDKVLFNKISNLAAAGSTLNETSTIPKTSYTIKQGSLEVAEWGIAVAHTLKAKTLAEVSVPEIIQTVLRNDMAKVLDSAVAAEFKSSLYKANIANTATTSFATDGTAAGAAAANMSDKNVRDIIDQMKKLNIPKRGSNYTCVASTNSIRGLYDFFEAKAQATTMDPLMLGEVGKYYGCTFVEETNVLSNVLGTYYGEAVFFGADAVREGIVIPEEIRMDIPKDFGRDMATAWYALLGFVKTWDYSTDGETRIIHVTST
jgi:N4-gp56 family major capsid protein